MITSEPQSAVAVVGGKRQVEQEVEIRATPLGRLHEKSVIIHKDENGFGLRIKGQAPVYIEHVHEGGAAWCAGVRAFDSLAKVNGVPVSQMDHKDVVLMFKSCSRFVALTLVSTRDAQDEHQLEVAEFTGTQPHRQDSIYSQLEGRHRYHHHNHHQRLNSSVNYDTASLFAPSDYAPDASFFMDRTLSCRSTVANSLQQHPTLAMTARSSNMFQQQQKLNRRDSSEDQRLAAGCENDKRVAVCSCCQQQPCQRQPGVEQTTHKHLIQRQQPKQAGEQQMFAMPPDKTNQLVGQQVAAPKPRVINKRVEIMREFIDTERTHTERLRCLDELFYRPLKQTGLLTGEQLRMVFSCHRTLYKIHRQIYRILLSAHFDICSEPMVGSALLEIFEGDLKRRLERAACSFCSAQATNIELLNKLTRRDTKVGEFLAQVTSQRMVGRLGIKDLLASCFQRLTKYPLLLENLLKATPEISQDSEGPLRSCEPYRVASSPQDSHVKSHEGGVNGGDRAGLGVELQEAELEVEEDEEELARRNSRRMLAISLAEEREFIERALVQSRQILVRVNDSVRISMSRNKLKEIWKRTDKYPGVPLIDITKQQVVHEGLLTLRLSKRSFDVYVLLLTDYIIILTREGQDKYRLKFFTPEGKSATAGAVAAAAAAAAVANQPSQVQIGSNCGANCGTLGQASAQATSTQTTTTTAAASTTTINATVSTTSATSGMGLTVSGASSVQSNLMVPHQTVYSPVFVIDEHLTTRDAATDENGFYLLCKRKDDSRIYEFASRSPAERMKWRDKIQWTIERQMSRNRGSSNNDRRTSCGSTLTKSSSEISANGLATAADREASTGAKRPSNSRNKQPPVQHHKEEDAGENEDEERTSHSRSASRSGAEPTKIVGTISYVIDDGIVMPNKMESSRVFVDQAIQVNILDGSKVSAARGQEGDSRGQRTLTGLHN